MRYTLLGRIAGVRGRPADAWFLDGDIARQSTTRAWWAAVVRLGDGQFGVVARAQLVALGIEEWAIDEWVKRALLHPWHRGVYAVGHRALSVAGRRLAAVLACGEGAGLCAQTAGDHLNVRPNASATVHVAVTGQHGRRITGIRPHRMSDLLPEDLEVVEGIRSTNAMRVLVDMAPQWSLEIIQRAFDRTELSGQFDLHTLRAIIDRRPRRPGAPKLHRAMEIYERPLPTLTELEEAGLRLVRRAGIPKPLVQCHTSEGRVDFFWPERALIMEMDSLRWHRSRYRFEQDRARDQAHLAEGIATIRVTWAQSKSPEAADRLRRIYVNRPRVVL